ncbi:MAG: VOC family protein [Acidobacteriia bacterium]|nr:VOC family protein [Terriglobia bacterium]
MSSQLSHFAINADDLDRAQKFYGRVFGWKFEPWGPPGFFHITTADRKLPGVRGALQKRRELIKGERANGFECTVSVDSIDRAIAAIEANGGTIVMQKTTIPGVGTLIFFKDPEGNVAGAMQYDDHAE